MSILKNRWFDTQYKIVPTYSQNNTCNGYVAMSRWLFIWYPLKRYQFNGDGGRVEVDAFFVTYEDAITYLQHEITLMTDEEVFGK